MKRIYSNLLSTIRTANTPLFFACFIIAMIMTTISVKGQAGSNWTSKPFNHQVFIENKGQFTSDINTSDKIIFQAILGKVKAYFTPSGIVYRYDEYPDKKQKMEKNSAPITHYASCIWDGSNSNVTIVAEGKQADYYTYVIDNNSVNANVFKKIIYKNIYPGIDVEYAFVEGKPGIKYSLIVHPGADMSLVKLKYSGTSGMQINTSGDMVVSTAVGEITEHSPVCFYQKSKEYIAGSYKIENGNEESFVLNASNNASDNLVIDPWVTNPAFSLGQNEACDLDYDNNGNVYVYGGYNPFQLVKFNNSGSVQWTFNATGISGIYYGDFTVDKTTGTSYIVEGADPTTGAKVLKINTGGTLMKVFSGSTNMQEMWRVKFNSCAKQLVIGGGEASTPYTQTGVLDTNLSTLTPVNSLSAADGYHNVCLMALDPTENNAYIAIAQTAANGNFNNSFASLLLPALSPANYIASDGFGFTDVGSIDYGAQTDGGYANAMNGMAASPDWLYMYDGDTLKKFDKNTAAITAVKQISATNPFQWGGLDADACDNVYVGAKAGIQVYNSSLSLISTLNLSDTVYDVVLGLNDATIYACGKGFVSQLTNPETSVVATTSPTNATCGLCNGQATANLTLCGTIPGSISYSWSPGGQTTQTATGLCAGTYTVTMNIGCGTVYQATATIIASGTPTVTASPDSAIICPGTYAKLTANGGITYTWKPATGLNSTTGTVVTATPTVTTTYTLVGSTGTGCTDSTTIKITVTPDNGFDLTGNLSVCIDTPGVSNASIQACIFNNRCTPTNGTLKLVLDTAFHITSTISDSIARTSGDTLIWNYDSVSDVGKTHCVSLTGSVSNIPVGDSIFVTMLISPSAGDSVPANNSVTYWITPSSQYCIGFPFDPNEKSVLPEGNISATQQLSYTIHFQNTGTAVAKNVVVIDTLSPYVDPTTLKVTSASSDVITTIASGKIVKFTFNNINLPDTATSKTTSIGVFKYTINPAASAAPGDIIYNGAGIYFDANPVVLTNKTKSPIVGGALFVDHILKPLNIAVFPNPATTSTSIVFNTNGKHYIELDDITGRKIESIECNGKQYKLSVNSLAKGIYFIRAYDEGMKYVATAKIVVQ
ncbi:MAG TPA: T9SS type A sorting domain-containing protein [Bacteroidia bacterium]|jgi:uncharacterized repeat protein (TIGR01451 family)|nr:T9SS type A sorting domain-containing protein [Bacteroidia bacterium]